jgi:hypothetical protein
MESKSKYFRAYYIKRPPFRPESVCSRCQGKIILDWVNKTPKWVHLDNKDTCSDLLDFSYATFELAKKYLLYILRNNIKLTFERICSLCTNNSILKLPDGIVEYDKNVVCYKGSMPDFPTEIVGINCQNKAVCGIQFYNINRDYINQSKLFPLFILDPINIINCWDVVTKPKNITLHEYGFCTQKHDIILSPLKSNPFITEDLTFTPKERVAIKLGFLTIEKAYSCRAQCLLEQAQIGSYAVDVKIWHNRNTDYNNIINKCLRCSRKCHKFICEKCVQDIKDKVPLPNKNRRGTSPSNLLTLRTALNWLYTIPGNWQLGDACYFCQRTYLTKEENTNFECYWNKQYNAVPCYTWWFGHKKRCCLICIDYMLRCQGLII